MSTEPVIVPAISYPESDGKPVGETDVHRQEILDLIAALSEHYRLDSLVYVSGNLMFYYKRGNPSAVVSPDVFVIKGVPKKERRTYKLWEEHKPPATIFEITSRSTRHSSRASGIGSRSNARAASCSSFATPGRRVPSPPSWRPFICVRRRASLRS